MYYVKTINNDNKEIYIAAEDIDVLDYITFKTAYNSRYPDSGKIVRIPEDYLYKNSRHHLKDFVIIDGKKDSKGNHVIIGFLGTSNINKNSIKLTCENNNELIGIAKLVISKDRYKRLIKKSKALPSTKKLNNIQLKEIKEISKKTQNVVKSLEFRT